MTQAADPREQGWPELVWCAISMTSVTNVIREYERWKFDTWYDDVDWTLVCPLLHDLLQDSCIDGRAADLPAIVNAAARYLTRPADQEGLQSLAWFPVTVVPNQIINGGHRLKAMLRQEVRTVSAQFVREDIGTTVDPLDLYPTRR